MRQSASFLAVRVGLLALLVGSAACIDLSGLDGLSNPVDPLVGGHLTEVHVSSDGVVEVGDTTIAGAIGFVDGVLAMFFYAPILDATWASSDPAVARVDRLPPAPGDSLAHAQAVVRGIAPGTVRVTATSQGLRGEATVRVISRLGSLDVLIPADTLAVGDTVPVTIRVLDEAGRPVAGLPIAMQAGGGVSLARPDTTLVLAGTAPGPAFVSVQFHGWSSRKDIMVVARSQ